jgi:hypothetical protein
MSGKRNNLDYLQKAAIYDLLACYYKYSHPQLHVHYYQKHLKYMNKALGMNRIKNANVKGSGESALVRILHAAPKTKNVDVYVNSVLLLKELPYKTASDYFALPQGKYQIDIYPAGTMIENIISKKITVQPGQHYTLAAISQANKHRLLAYSDQPDIPANESKVRFIHLSPDAPTIDIAVKKGDVVFSEVSFKEVTNYLGLSPMTVNLEARIAGSSNIALSLPKIELKSDEAYTIIAVGLVKDEPLLETIILKG